jgi:hypothetical protein
MCTEYSAHFVNRIEVKADSAPCDTGSLCWWQEISLFNDSDQRIGRVVIFLTRPDVALPIGDQPPYWEVTTNPPAQMMDGEAPF